MDFRFVDHIKLYELDCKPKEPKEPKDKIK